MRPFLIALLLGGLSLPLYGQSRDSDVRLRLAESYERSGDFASAVKIYNEIYARDSSNVALFDALRRGYLQLKQYPEAIALIESMLRRRPNDLVLLVELGSAYSLKPDDAKATDAWERAIATDPKHETTYRIVASAMMQSRLLDRAITIYQRGRTACGDPLLFASDIAYLDAVMLNYGEATREYLKVLRQTPAQLNYIQSRIAMYTGKKDGLTAATQAVEQAVHDESGNLNIRRLLGWLYVEGKQYDKAYDVTKIIDAQSKAGGHELYNFADRALREKAYAAAARAYQDILKTFPKFDLAAQVKFGYARTLEEPAAASDTLNLFGSASPFPDRPESEAIPRFTGAIAAYNDVIGQYPNTEIAARSLLRIATLKQERFFDLQGARSSLETLVEKYGAYPAVAFDARLRLGDVYLSLGDLDRAAREYQSLAGPGLPAGQAGLALSDQRSRASFRLAQLDYFQTHFQDALTKLKALTSNPSLDVTNDAMALQIFIQDNLKSNEPALKQYAAADLLLHQHKLSEALTRFQQILSSGQVSDLTDETLISVGDILVQMQRFPDALSAYERLVKDYPESISVDRTMFKIAQVYQFGTKETLKALAAYGQLLERYPNSIYVSEARRRIRELRGDNI